MQMLQGQEKNVAFESISICILVRIFEEESTILYLLTTVYFRKGKERKGKESGLRVHIKKEKENK